MEFESTFWISLQNLLGKEIHNANTRKIIEALMIGDQTQVQISAEVGVPQSQVARTKKVLTENGIVLDEVK